MGQIIMAGGFMVEVGPHQSTGPNTFTGQGFVTLPLYDFAVRVNLNNIQVNLSGQLPGDTITAMRGDELIIMGSDNDPNATSTPGQVDFTAPNDTLLVEMFNQWLINKGFGINTANDYSKFIEKKFKLYLHENQLIIDHLEHEILMQYIHYRKSLGIQAKTINLELKKISYYLEFKGLPNIAEPIRLKGVQRRIPHDLFTQKQLDNIYNKFPESKTPWTHENTLKTYHLILGLRTYQGLQEQELAKLEIHHLHLDKGKIYVPSTKRTNKRILDLKPFQILPLLEYLLTERKLLNEEIEGNYLFHKKRLIRGMSRIKTMIIRYEPRLKSMAQIRASVITI